MTWEARLQSQNTYQTPLTPNLDSEYATTLAQGFSNAPHTLELVARDGKDPPSLPFAFTSRRSNLSKFLSDFARGAVGQCDSWDLKIRF